jgi:hypothetical protein
MQPCQSAHQQWDEEEEHEGETEIYAVVYGVGMTSKR